MKPFEICVKNFDFDKGPLAVMSSFTLIGPYDTGANSDLLNGVLRGKQKYHVYCCQQRQLYDRTPSYRNGYSDKEDRYSRRDPCGCTDCLGSICGDQMEEEKRLNQVSAVLERRGSLSRLIRRLVDNQPYSEAGDKPC